jgi:hypothetical protein
MSSRGYFDAVASDWDAMRRGFFSERVREAAVQTAGPDERGVEWAWESHASRAPASCCPLR